MAFLELLVLACCSSASPQTGALRQAQDHAATVVRLAEVESPGGTQSGELRIAASSEGILIAWIDGEGSELSLGVEDAAGDELEHVEQELPRTPARLELPAKAGESYVIRWEASACKPWGWLRVSARVASESEATLSAAKIARDALGLGRELAAKGDLEAQRALIEGAVCEISALPGISASRAGADALWNLVFPAYSCGALESALAASTQTVEIRGRFEPKTSRLVQMARIGVSIVLSELQRIDDAARLGAEIEGLYDFALSEDDPELAKVRLNLANYLRLTGELDRPAVLIGRALAVYECRLPIESDERQRAMEIAAELDAALGRSEQAAARFRDLYRLALQSKDENKLQATAGNYAIVLSDCGELEMAREIEEANLERAERRLPKSHPRLIQLRENLAVTLLNLGDLPRARELLEQSLAALEDHEDSDRSGLVRVLCNFGELERRAENLPRARELFERAVKLAAEIEDKNFAALPLNGLAQTLITAGDPEAAQPILEGLIAQRVAGYGDAHLYTQSARISLAGCLLARGEFGRAGELCELALSRLQAALPATHVRIFEARYLLCCSRVHADPRRASSDLQRWELDVAMSLARESLGGSPRFVEERAYSWRNSIGVALGLALDLGGDSALAEASLCLLETKRASSLWTADALRLAGESESAASVREEIARLSRELSRAGAAQPPDTAELGRLTASKDGAERRLVAGLAASSAAVAWGEPVDLQRVRAALGPRSAALSYTSVAGKTGESIRVVAFVLRPGAPTRMVDLGAESDIEEAVLLWRRALGTEGSPAQSPQMQQACGEALRKLVFDPLRENLQGVEQIFLAQDGALNLIAIDALPDAAKVLGDSYSVVCVPSLAVLAPGAPRRECAREVVLIGGLDYGAGPLALLAGSGAEVDRLAEVYRGSKRAVKVLRERDANRQTFAALMAEAGILHIATHGELSPSSSSSEANLRGSARGVSPLSSAQTLRELSPLALCGLALSGANEKNESGEREGFVRGIELASMDASRCELVVLSACDTRAGVERPGLAVASLEKAMHLAGARAVLASLWQVDDAQSRELMVEFHRGLVESGLSPAAALWRAKNLLRSRRAPLRAWAGWILSSTDAGKRE